MGKKFEIWSIILSLVIIVIMITGLVIDYQYEKSSEDRDKNLSSQFSELNSNVVKLLPKEPEIDITAVSNRDYPGSQITEFEEIGYFECMRNTLFPIENNQEYERVLIWFENKGKKTIDFRANIECSPSSPILAICKTSENLGIEADNSVFIEGIIRIKELDYITSENVHFFYELKEENKTTCSIDYDSSDFEQGKSQTIEVSPSSLPSKLF